MKPLRFSKAELAVIKAGLEMYGVHRPVEKKYCDAALDKIAVSELSISQPKQPVISIDAAVIAMESVLGKGAMAVPVNAPRVWYVKLSARMRSLGLGVLEFKKMAKALEAKGWRAPYSFERSVWAADRLLAEAGMDAPKTGATYQAPRMMEDF